MIPLDEKTIKKIEEQLDIFYKITGMNTRFIDTDGNDVIVKVSEEHIHDFCDLVMDIAGEKFDCIEPHRNGFMNAQRFGGRYFYTCRAGHAFIISHIVINGKVVGGIKAGPISIIEPEDAFLIEPLKEKVLPMAKVNTLMRYLEYIPKCTPQMLNVYSKMLFTIAAYISSLDYYVNMTNQENQETVMKLFGSPLTSGNLSSKNYPFDKETEMLQAITEGDSTTARRLLNEILGFVLFHNGGNLNRTKNSIRSLIVLFTRAAINAGIKTNEVSAMQDKYMDEIEDKNDATSLCVWLLEVLDKYTKYLINTQKETGKDAINNAISYIKENYNKHISLDDLCDNVHLSKAYLSKLFKKHAGCNFTVYLNRLRIEKSKYLLLQSDQSIIDIAVAIGFEDQSYFSKVFKQIVGVSPGVFRETKGQIKVFDEIKNSNLNSIIKNKA